MRRVLVCGGRDYTDVARLEHVLDALHTKHGFTVVAHGAARGADTLAGLWAQSRGLDVCEYPADWKRDGKGAGLVRNIRMLNSFRPDAVIAFPGGSGTAHMVAIAKGSGTLTFELL